jgi:ATP-dependent DNA helicase RecQ
MDPLHASDQAHAVLQQYWGYDAFRPMQEDVVLSVMKGKDTLALMPTGGGKSLCYQVPALCQEGTCLVISPLIALMKDQVEGLRKRNITAFAIYSGMSRREVINTLTVVAESNCKFLYVSPERLETSLFREYLPALGISLIAVDEAHCISQWVLRLQAALSAHCPVARRIARRAGTGSHCIGHARSTNRYLPQA